MKNLIRPNVGEEITFIKKAVTGHEKPDHFHPTFLRVTRVGTKYAYGYINHYSKVDGAIVETHKWESKWDLSQIKIVDRKFNMRYLLIHRAWTKSVQEQEDARRKYYTAIKGALESKMYSTLKANMATWDKSAPEIFPPSWIKTEVSK